MKVREFPAYEVFADDGTLVGVFKVTAEWEGLLRLQSMEDHKQVAIIEPERRDLFDRILNGVQPVEATLIKASPDIVYRVRGGEKS